MPAANETISGELQRLVRHDQEVARSRLVLILAARHDPWRGDDDADPIPWLAAELVETYWRGTEDEANGALDEYLSQRVGSDD